MTDDPDDPLLRPASEAGWDDDAVVKPAAAKPEAAKPEAETPAVASVDPEATVVVAEEVAAPAEAVAPPVTEVMPSAAEAVTSPVIDAVTAPVVDAVTAPVADAKPADDAKPAADAKPVTDAKATDEPLLPAKYDANALRAAVGASPLVTTTSSYKRRVVDDDDDDAGDLGRPRNRKAIAFTALGIVAALGILALVILGRVNSGRYLLACEAERAVPQQGRSFPPWGVHDLDGEAWRPLKITAETRCQPHETDSPTTLQRLYLTMLLEQTTAILSAREVTRVDEADVLLKQSLLLTRPPERESEALATERVERHKEVERMLGDVAYWRASAKLRDAAAQLADAAKQFERAAAQHPRHVSDAPAWAAYAQRIAQELRAGPAGLARTPGMTPNAPTPVASGSAAAPAPAGAGSATSANASERPSIPVGTALPVEPGPPAGTEHPVAPAPATDVPTGGVLL